MICLFTSNLLLRRHPEVALYLSVVDPHRVMGAVTSVNITVLELRALLDRRAAV